MSIPLILFIPHTLCERNMDGMEECALAQACIAGQNFVFAANEERSAIFEWKLVCENVIYSNLIPLGCLCGMAYLGTAMSCVLAGQLGDSAGRKRSLLWMLLCSCVCQFILYCSASAPFFTVVVFFVGLFVPAPALLAVVLLSEITDKRARGPFLTMLCMFWVLGTASSYSASFYFLSWRPFLVISTGYGLVFFAFFAAVQESPRFFAANLSRYQRARAALHAIATRNKCEMFEDKLLGEKLNEYDETGATKLADDRKHGGEKVDEKPQLPNEYIGSAQNIDEREKELSRGQHCSYVDLVKLKSLRGDVVRLCAIAAVLAVDLAEAIAPLSETVHGRYFQRGVAVAVSFSVLVLVGLTANFAGRKLLMRLALFSMGCAGATRIVLPEISLSGYMQLGYIAMCTLAVAVLVQLTIEAPATPARCLFMGAVTSCGVFVWTGAKFVVLFVPAHHAPGVLVFMNLMGLVGTWRMRETAKKRLKDFVEEMMMASNIPMVVGPGDQSSDPKRVGAPKEPSFDAFNEEVRGLE